MKTPGYLRDYALERPLFSEMESYLQSVPEEARVVCSTCLLPHVSQRGEVYEDYYYELRERAVPDLVLIDLRYEHTGEIRKFAALGFSETDRIVCQGKDLILIMKKELPDPL